MKPLLLYGDQGLPLTAGGFMASPSYEFKFNIEDADSETKRKANLRLVELLALAPPGAKAVGVMDKDGRHYISAIEISSPYRSFFEKAFGLTPQSAIRRALDRIEDKLYYWRYGGGSHDPETGAQIHFNQRQTQ